MTDIAGFLCVGSSPAMPPDSMLPFLAAAARDAREAADRLQVQVAAELRMREETIARFEQGKHWPRSPDKMIAAYARDLGIEPWEIWADALKRWRQEQ